MCSSFCPGSDRLLLGAFRCDSCSEVATPELGSLQLGCMGWPGCKGHPRMDVEDAVGGPSDGRMGGYVPLAASGMGACCSIGGPW